MPWSARFPVALGFFTIAICLGGAIAWAVLATIQSAVVGQGTVSVAQNRQIVQHPDGGVVTKIHIINGQSVGAGDVLFTLDDSRVRSELLLLETQYFELLARRRRLEAERDGTDGPDFSQDNLQLPLTGTLRDAIAGQQQMFAARHDIYQQNKRQLQHQRDQAKVQVEGLGLQLNSIERQRELTADHLADSEILLKKGLIPAAKVIGLSANLADLDGKIGLIKANIAAAQGDIFETALKMSALELTRHEDATKQLRDLALREISLRHEHGTLQQRLGRLQIRASVNGLVHGLNIHAENAVIRPAEPLMYLIPQDRPLVISAQISQSEIDQVFVGQTVNLRLSSANPNTTPDLLADVATLSADIYDGPAGTAPFYLAELHLREGEIAKLPRGQKLVPGMRVDTFFGTGNRSPLTYLTKPFSEFFSKALRES